jgi:hypothetical protein
MGKVLVLYDSACGNTAKMAGLVAEGAGSVPGKSVNIYMTFEEALKISLAIQSCVMNLNRYNRRKAAGRDMGMLLSLKTEANAITVIETNVTTRRRKPAASGQDPVL